MKLYQKYLIENKHLHEIEPLTVTAMGIAGGLAVSLTNMISSMWLNTLNSAAKKCNTILDTKEKSGCMLNMKIQGAKQIISKLQTSKSACKGSKSCIDKIDKKIESKQNQIKTLTDQLRFLTRPSVVKHVNR
jgi:hypothetical protein